MMLSHLHPIPEIFNPKKPETRFEELLSQYDSEVKALVHAYLEKTVEEKFQEFMGPRIGTEQKLQSGQTITDYRNGYRYIKQLLADTLVLKNFQMPRNRAGGFFPEMLKQGERYAGIFAQLAQEIIVNGVSTRRTRRAFERAGIKLSGISKSSVSRHLHDLRKDYLAWVNRKFTDEFVYLQIDGAYFKLRKDSNNKVGTLIVTGVTEAGKKEVLYFTQGNESEINVDEIFQNLIRRGLNPEKVRLITTDGAKGPIAAINNIFPKKLQRCVVHKSWNLLGHTPKALRGEFKAKLNRLWNQSSRVDAERFLASLVEEYKLSNPAAIKNLLADKDDLFRFFDFPESHRKTIRSTNLVERVIRETKRRVKAMDIIQDSDSHFKYLFGVIREQNHRWESRSFWRNS